jgi:DNA (cytosine-5)-methyltransferase 1
MLSSLNTLGYAVEWRVINAAEYGMPQRRKRIFILAYHRSSEIYKQLESARKPDWIADLGIIAQAFPLANEFGKKTIGTIHSDLLKVSDGFNKKGGASPFENSGVMVDGKYWTFKTTSKYTSERTVLEDILLQTEEVPEEFFIAPEEIKKQKGWEYQKGAKKIERTNSQGHKYVFAEGGMTFPDALDVPSRTIITGEGGASPSRFKHVIFKDGRYRRLMPIELERLNMFPDNHTKMDGVSDLKRAFFMGNALVVGVVKQLGTTLTKNVERLNAVESISNWQNDALENRQ